MRLTGPLGAELNQVVVAFTEWNQSNQLQQFASAAKALWIEANALNQRVDPVVGAELSSVGDIAIEVEVR